MPNSANLLGYVETAIDLLDSGSSITVTSETRIEEMDIVHRHLSKDRTLSIKRVGNSLKITKK